MKTFERFRYRSPLAQVVLLGVICFCCPGMFNALGGLGGAGKAESTITDNANTALSVTFAVFSLLAGGVFNVVGHRLTLLLGGLTYVLYVGSYLSYNAFFVIFAGAVLGVGAGFLWAAQGAIMISYPDEKDKGKFIGIFWGIFNLGGTLGSVVALIIEWGNSKSHVGNGTYIAFMAIMAFGAILSVLLLPPSKVIRDDGTAVSPYKYSDWRTEAVEIFKLFGDWRMVTLVPMFICSNWFYTYQFNDVNGGGKFSIRSRAFNGALYWAAQVLGSNVMGHTLDNRFMRRSGRAWLGLAILAVLVVSVWGGGLAFQLTFTRESVKLLSDDKLLDLAKSSSYAGPVVLYTCYGLFDAFWQTYIYWLLGALTNNSEQAARFSGFYKAIQNAGNAMAAQVDAKKVSYLWELIINWILVALGVVCAIPVVMSVKDTLATHGKTELYSDEETTGGNIETGSPTTKERGLGTPADESDVTITVAPNPSQDAK